VTGPRLRLLSGGVLCLIPSLLLAEPLSFVSPKTRVSMVELFTSHGCSSCPPAEAWLGRLAQRSDLWQGVVPVAFHVDYWDYLGWQDRYASPVFSQRQRQYRQAGGIDTVYTPGMLVNGEEWRGWYRGEPVPRSDDAIVGQLSLMVEAGRSAEIDFTPDVSQPMTDLVVHVAVLGSGIESEIEAGENRGRSLRGDFVVLGYQSIAKRDANNHWHMDWPALKASHASRYAVAAWISRGGNPSPLQATGGWLQ
jgi:hypothetical protein